MVNIGQNISSYQLLAQIASGGQATVYRARHTVLQREVALKVLHPHLIPDASFVQKFAQEAQLLAQLKHPNIVEVYNAGYDAAAGAYFIEMELLPGSDLETLIAQQGRLAVDVVVNVAKQVASTLEYAHARGLIHRDIKPSNIILLPDGRVKVLDFGIAAIVAAGQKARTRIGTVEYMAPEHFAGNADARSDIYSLGATLYHCLAGQVPPLVASQPPTPVRQLNPAVSPALENVILKSLQADVAKRQQTAREFILEIENALRAPMSVSAPATMQCPHCGAQNRKKAKRCKACGRALIAGPKVSKGSSKIKAVMGRLGFPKDYEPRFYWSPSGSNLLLVGKTDYGEPIGMIIDIEPNWGGIIGKNTISYVRIDAVAVDSSPNWSPNGKEIAYISARDGNVWVYDLVTQADRPLPFGDGTHKDPQWSPDGRYLAYSQGEYPNKIWLITDGGHSIRSRVAGNSHCVGWSPRGKCFACIDSDGMLSTYGNGYTTKIGMEGSRSGQIGQVTWVSDTRIAISTEWTALWGDGGEFIGVATDLFNIENRTWQREWLPCLHFESATNSPWRIAGNCRSVRVMGSKVEDNEYLVWAETSQNGFHRVLQTKTKDILKVSGWSPDATKILFTRAKLGKPSSSEICVVNIDDTGLQKLTDGFNPKWSSDGRYIAFLRSPQEKVYELWVMEVE